MPMIDIPRPEKVDRPWLAEPFDVMNVPLMNRTAGFTHSTQHLG
jgi:hypothetical protein